MIIAALPPLAIYEPAPVQCIPISGGIIQIENGIMYFTGWTLVPGISGNASEYHVSVRTATPMIVARSIVHDASKALLSASH